ncbi:MAG: hypothetical protein FD177_2562 [Desulfovibrionaceae bacterium]|nr:MAG: hypothetical protein FD177_2562 [Desulfovibrionaceae bacterium]
MCWSIVCLLETVKAEWMSYLAFYGVLLVSNHVSSYYDKSKVYSYSMWFVLLVGGFVAITIARHVVSYLRN